MTSTQGFIPNSFAPQNSAPTNSALQDFAPWSLMGATKASKSSSSEISTRPNFGDYTTVTIAQNGQKYSEIATNPYQVAQADPMKAVSIDQDSAPLSLDSNSASNSAATPLSKQNEINISAGQAAFLEKLSSLNQFPRQLIPALSDAGQAHPQATAAPVEPVDESTSMPQTSNQTELGTTEVSKTGVDFAKEDTTKLVKPVAGDLGEKLSTIPQAAGGVNLSYLPGALAPTDTGKADIEKADTGTKSEQVSQISAQKAPVFKELSKDVRQQLDRIGQLQGHDLSQTARQATDHSKATAAYQAQQPARKNTAALAQLAAYDSSSAVKQNPFGGEEQQNDISKAMMNALKKYDTLLNGN